MNLAPVGRLGHRLATKVNSTSAVFNYNIAKNSLKSLAPTIQAIKMVESKDLENALASLRLHVQEQGNIVRSLKSSQAPDSEVKYALAELKARKRLLEEKELELMPPVLSFDRGKLEDLLKQKFFYDQSFAIYGGVQGLYDYGPMGCAMKANLLQTWRQHFVLEDQLLEVECSMLTPAAVLEASGHVERFTDLMVKDLKTGECFRADHLVKAFLEARQKQKKTTEAEKAEITNMLVQLDNYGREELDGIIRRYDMRSPITNNEVSEPQEFNLMFSTSIGPTGQYKGFLRPETAQGIFVNFQRLLQFNQGRVPFGAAQIGSAFRNEISPRSGLIRVREFAMAEIEYFVDPANKKHPKFSEVKDVVMALYSSCDQMDGKSVRNITIGEAVEQGIVANETLGYFMARINLFLQLVGVDRNRLRFRQHLSNEMAHYACDCWDAECLTSYGWIECVGCADRSCYDLMQHTKATGTRLVAEKRLPEPRKVRVCECVPVKQSLGKVFRSDSKLITEQLSSLNLDEALALKEELASNGQANLTVQGKCYVLKPDMVRINDREEVIHVEEIVPNVIEPSFGIGRILYTVFEHSFRIREGDEQRTYLSVAPILAPYKCSVLPLSNQPDFNPFIRQLSVALTRIGVSHRLDESSGSIGRRYARTDQIAIPYGITIDFDTVNKTPATATLRERDSMKQIRVPSSQERFTVSVSDRTINGARDDIQSLYPLHAVCDAVFMKTGIHHTLIQFPLCLALSLLCHAPFLSKATKAPPAATTQEDWQSVSEDVDEVGKHEGGEHETWSSATETGEVEISSTKPTTSKQQTGTPQSRKLHTHATAGTKKQQRAAKKTQNQQGPSSEIPSEVVVHTETVPTDVCNETTDIDLSGKKSITWNDWGKAVRKHYQEEETRDKYPLQQLDSPLESNPPTLGTGITEGEEACSFQSGYEADQEDNALSKSVTTGLISPLTRDQDTTYELSPALQSSSEDSSKETAPKLKPPSQQNLDTDFPPLAGSGSNMPNHGLFLGHGWPGEKVSANKQNASKAPTNHESTPTNDWPEVMSKIFDRTGELDTYANPLDNMFAFSLLEVAQPSKPIEETKENVSIEAEERMTDEHHGLFIGSGWHGSKKTVQHKPPTTTMTKVPVIPPKLNDSNIIPKKTDTVVAPSTEPSADDWPSVIAQVHENTITSDTWSDPFDFGIRELNLTHAMGKENRLEVTSPCLPSSLVADTPEKPTNITPQPTSTGSKNKSKPVNAGLDITHKVDSDIQLACTMSQSPTTLPRDSTPVPQREIPIVCSKSPNSMEKPSNFLESIAASVIADQPLASDATAPIESKEQDKLSPEPEKDMTTAGDASAGDALTQSAKHKNKRRKPKKKK